MFHVCAVCWAEVRDYEHGALIPVEGFERELVMEVGRGMWDLPGLPAYFEARVAAGRRVTILRVFCSGACAARAMAPKSGPGVLS